MRKSVLTVVNTWNQKLLYFILIMRCCPVAIKEAAIIFFSCFLFLEVVGLPLRTSIAVPCVRVSNVFYAFLRLLKAGNSGGLPSLFLLVFPYFMSMNHLFGHTRTHKDISCITPSPSTGRLVPMRITHLFYWPLVTF